MKRIIILGSNPAFSSSTNIPFDDCKSGKVLKEKWLPKLGLTLNEVKIINIVDYKTEKNKALTKKQIKEALPDLKNKLLGESNLIITLGKSVDFAIDLLTKHLTKDELLLYYPLQIITLPHPSSLNRKLNDKDSLEQILFKYSLQIQLQRGREYVLD